MPIENFNPKEPESIDIFLQDPFFLPVSAKTYFATIDPSQSGISFSGISFI